MYSYRQPEPLPVDFEFKFPARQDRLTRNGLQRYKNYFEKRPVCVNKREKP